ncbi:tetratricopeptide repeat-containing sensor histidine kinase [Flavobacterium dankookense]|uniref:tetratricopeptide repeat-containing sensor histidine kinase n=1 Tax=Flavobacterium dankookense TaxID=706186 RepID=UPI0013C2A0AF|nr:tetratricopeptide repeat protein [Flavobacterium dankookense]
MKRVVKATKIDTTRANLYNQIADEYKVIHPDSTAAFALKASTLSKQKKFEFGYATSFINLGNAKIILGDYKKAKQTIEKAIHLFENLVENEPDNKRNKIGLARAYASFGVISSEENNYGLALENYQKSLQLYVKLNEKVGISKAYNNIGIVYKSERNNKKALEYLKKAAKIQEEIGEQTLPVTFTNIGVIYFEKNDLKNALIYYSKAKKIFETIENKRGNALLLNYLGDFYKTENKITEAIENYNASIAMSESIANKFVASLALYNLGQLHYEQKQVEKALPYAEKSLQYAKEIGVLDQTFHSEKLLSEIHEIKGNDKLSLQHYKAYIQARDSIINLENNKKFLRAEMNFEYQMKESVLMEKSKQNKLITFFSIIGGLLLIGLVFVIFNRRQVKRRLTLQKEVAEYEQKALHLQMNPHFVFNCLGSISSFIVQNGTDQALKYLSKFSKLMRLTLEYSKGSIIPIDKEIESLQNYLELEQLRFHNKFVFKISSSDSVEFNMGLPPLLIQPFVENAILHGLVPKESNGKIEVSFVVKENQLVCTITDDGIGISKSKEIKQNSMQAHQSMALEITKKRLEIMEATISKSAQIEIKEIEENNNIKGTRVTLKLPIQYIQ